MKWKKRVMFFNPLLQVVFSWCDIGCDTLQGFLCTSPVLPTVLCVPSLLIMAIFKPCMVSVFFSLIEMVKEQNYFHRKN